MSIRLLFIISISLSLIACGGSSSSQAVNPPVPAPTPNADVRPQLLNIQANTQTIGLYEKIEWKITANAEHNNPFDRRDISLDARFTSPNNQQVSVAGYWDTREGWMLRFAPNQVGTWQFAITMTNKSGTSEQRIGQFNVTSSGKKGWIQPANLINASYSSRYFLHQDGSEFYGIGHSDTFAIFRNSDTAEQLLARMKNAKENYFVWWPFYYFSMVVNDYQNYHLLNTEAIDDVIEKTEQANMKLVFTLWDHSQLRDNNHPWENGRWHTHNGFNRLTNANDFFTNNEAWQWQQNLYRYIIARWGHSSAIAMWQTVSEVDGTNAFEHTNTWHQKITNYFKEHDPYGHPVTASMAGDKSWPEGHQVMDVPQVHIYRDLLTDKDNARSPAKIIDSASIIASYTQQMWQSQPKPNWIGEFGVINHPINPDQNYYPEVFHNALWAALSSGSAMTPAEWNDFSDWGNITSSMTTTLQHFSTFVERLSLAKWAPSPLTITVPTEMKAWGIASEQGGMIWLQDIQLRGESITQIRSQRQPTSPINIEINNLKAGDYQITPYRTQEGEFLTAFTVSCQAASPCVIAIPSFVNDIALLITP